MSASASGSGAPPPSPYVFGPTNANYVVGVQLYSYSKRKGNNSGRQRPQTKALRLARWQGVDFEAPSLAAQAASAPGPPQARFIGRGQLDRETPTDTTTCKHAIAQLQNIVESKLLAACNAALPAAAAQLEREGTPEGQALAAAARSAEFVPKRFAYEAFDSYLRIGGDYFGLGVQHRVAKLKQHWKLAQRERHFFKAQAAVVRLRQLAVLCTGYSLRALAASELPPRSISATQLGTGFEEELQEFEEEQGLEQGQLALEDIEGDEADEDYYFNAEPFPKCDTATDFVMQLLKKALLVEPLEDVSAATGLQHPHRFLSAMQEEAARLLAAAADALGTLPDGWELLFPASEGYGASLCLVPPPGATMQSLGLREGLSLSLAEVSLEQMIDIVQLAVPALGGQVEQAAQLLQATISGQGTTGLVQGVETLQQAAADAEAWVMQQYLTEAEATGAAGQAVAAAAGGEEEAPSARNVRPRRATAAPPSAAPAPAQRMEWTASRVEAFDAAIDKLGVGLDAKPAAILQTIADPGISLLQMQSYLQKRRQKEQGIVGSMLPRPAPPPWAASRAAHTNGGERSSSGAAAASGSYGGSAEAGPSSASNSQQQVSTAAGSAARAQGSLLGLPPLTHRAFDTRVKGAAPRPPASTALLTLLDDDRVERAIVVRVLDAGRRLRLSDRVAGYKVVYGSLGQLMMRSGQAFLLVNRDSEQATAPNMLFHAAAVVGKGLLAGGTAEPAAFAAAALKQDAELQAQVQSTLLVSSRDATAAAAAGPALARLAVTCFLAASHASGVNLAGGGTMVRLNGAERQEAAAGRVLPSRSTSDSAGEGGEVDGSDDEGAAAASADAGGWLSSLLQLCSSQDAAEQLRNAASQLVQSGVATWVTLRNTFAHLRPKLKQAGVEVTVHANAACQTNALSALGGGSAERGEQIKAAIDAWEQGLRALGAGPMPGLMTPQPGDLPAWRAKVELGWPEAAAVFDAALAAGAAINQLGNRWKNASRVKGAGAWCGKDPAAPLASQLKPAKRKAL